MVADGNEISLRYYFYPNLDLYVYFDTEEFVYKKVGEWISSFNTF